MHFPNSLVLLERVFFFNSPNAITVSDLDSDQTNFKGYFIPRESL